MPIIFDAARQAVFAEWAAAAPYDSATWLTWPLTEPPETATEVNHSQLDPKRIYQVGYPDPYDAGEIGGDIQQGVAWTRRWATWQGLGNGWLVADLAAYIVVEDGSRSMLQQATVYRCGSLHSASDGHSEETFYWARHRGENLDDTYVRDHVASYDTSDVGYAFGQWEGAFAR